jgi:hypothetical protein
MAASPGAVNRAVDVVLQRIVGGPLNVGLRLCHAAAPVFFAHKT